MNYLEHTLEERFKHLLNVVTGERFLKMQGLGNEVPFFICPYEPEKANEMDKIRQQLVNTVRGKGIEVLEVDLYDLSVDVLKRDGDWEWYLENEQSMSKAKLLEDLQGILDIEGVLAPEIGKLVSSTPHEVVFLSGVGEVFPFIRSHNVLNNIQSVASDKPLVMFFPGVYTQSLDTGASLDLFGRLHDDKYYRAFNIFHCEA